MMVSKADKKNTIGIAVDLGSTTIAVSCFNLEKKEELKTFSFPNPQHVYGTDVITRIRHCMEKEKMLFKLGSMVRERLMEELKEALGAAYPNICRVVYSGNTTMLHILRGLSVNGLAAAPFLPIDIEYTEEKAKENQAVTVVYPPGFSAFVGADILTGAEFLQMGREDTYDLLIDLGTNGEMLLLNKEHGYAASTACGPVFDYVITGAAYGSENIRAIAGCVKRGLIDVTGRIKEPFFDRGIAIDKNFVIRQGNVRKFQLAKGAVYAGIQCLLKEAGITEDEVAKIYISGGLGFFMDIRDTFTLRMIPGVFAGKVQISGNSSLMGARKLLLAEGKEKACLLEQYEDMRNRTVSYELANLEEFQDIYMSALEF